MEDLTISTNCSQKIRDIRASEKRFYQKLRDLFKLSSDYVAEDKSTQMFFAETQNKLLYAVTYHTAAEIVMERADAQKQNMGLTSWKGSIVRKQDVIIAKNYLSNEELDKLNRLVTIFLESAELRVKERKDLTIDFWRKKMLTPCYRFRDKRFYLEKEAFQISRWKNKLCLFTINSIKDAKRLMRQKRTDKICWNLEN